MPSSGAITQAQAVKLADTRAIKHAGALAKNKQAVAQNGPTGNTHGQLSALAALEGTAAWWLAEVAAVRRLAANRVDDLARARVGGRVKALVLLPWVHLGLAARVFAPVAAWYGLEKARVGAVDGEAVFRFVGFVE